MTQQELATLPKEELQTRARTKNGTFLTNKQLEWLSRYLELGNATEAVLQVYTVKSRESANKIGFQNLQKIDFARLMEYGGISDAVLHNKLKEGLEAKRVISAVKGTSANGATTDFIEIEDYATRHKYLETALKLKKHLGNEQKDGQVEVKPLVTFNIQVNNNTIVKEDK